MPKGDPATRLLIYWVTIYPYVCWGFWFVPPIRKVLGLRESNFGVPKLNNEFPLLLLKML